MGQSFYGEKKHVGGQFLSLSLFVVNYGAWTSNCGWNIGIWHLKTSTDKRPIVWVPREALDSLRPSDVDMVTIPNVGLFGMIDSP